MAWARIPFSFTIYVSLGGGGVLKQELWVSYMWNVWDGKSHILSFGDNLVENWLRSNQEKAPCCTWHLAAFAGSSWTCIQYRQEVSVFCFFFFFPVCVLSLQPGIWQKNSLWKAVVIDLGCVPLANQLFSINDFYRIKVIFQRFASVQILIISTFAHICIEPYSFNTSPFSHLSKS